MKEKLEKKKNSLTTLVNNVTNCMSLKPTKIHKFAKNLNAKHLSKTNIACVDTPVLKINSDVKIEPEKKKKSFTDLFNNVTSWMPKKSSKRCKNLSSKKRIVESSPPRTISLESKPTPSNHNSNPLILEGPFETTTSSQSPKPRASLVQNLYYTTLSQNTQPQSKILLSAENSPKKLRNQTFCSNLDNGNQTAESQPQDSLSPVLNKKEDRTKICFKYRKGIKTYEGSFGLDFEDDNCSRMLTSKVMPNVKFNVIRQLNEDSKSKDTTVNLKVFKINQRKYTNEETHTYQLLSENNFVLKDDQMFKESVLVDKNNCFV